ncbi:hypothetical protein OAA86_11065 [Rhodospirillales bacterium]|nr:hypothetical protein [Rhodospirillales bacterium]
MKTLLTITTLVFTLMFSSTSFTEEIKMKCTYNGEQYNKENKIYLKYSNPLFGKTNVYTRIEGEWLEWCQNLPKENIKENWKDNYDHLPDDLDTWSERRIKDKGAVCIQANEIRESINKKEYFVCSARYTIDFELLSRTVRVACGYGSDWKKTEEWQCEELPKD